MCIQKSKAIPETGHGGSIDVRPVRCDHLVRIKSKAISVTGRGSRGSMIRHPIDHNLR
jgi:hypothetical protein